MCRNHACCPVRLFVYDILLTTKPFVKFLYSSLQRIFIKNYGRNQFVLKIGSVSERLYKRVNTLPHFLIDMNKIWQTAFEMGWHTRRNQISSFARNGRVHLNRPVGGVSSVDCWQPRCAPSAVVMLDTPCSEVV